MRSNSSLVYDTQCVHYAERRVSMHGSQMDVVFRILHAILIVGFDVRINFRWTCGYCASRMCSIEFNAPLGTKGNGIENNIIGCWLMLHKERVIFLQNGWILENC
ncbi:hypothetical protein NE237_010812 [Protea cynaroides]|uniref:Uncharacterized protein n=1 Tax=Protea cynaroides TaxID=273540 RepID=A0A9Q0L027_9MAGN|nr:hypothetical protein NE237_010812 [Protea cynaroides]